MEAGEKYCFYSTTKYIRKRSSMTMPYSEIQQAADFHIQAVSSAMLMEGCPDLAKQQLAALHP